MRSLLLNAIDKAFDDIDTAIRVISNKIEQEPEKTPKYMVVVEFNATMKGRAHIISKYLRREVGEEESPFMVEEMSNFWQTYLINKTANEMFELKESLLKNFSETRLKMLYEVMKEQTLYEAQLEYIKTLKK